MFWASYIALDLSENDLKFISKEVKAILKDIDGNIAWHNLMYYHITLVFLGWLSKSDAKKVLTIIERYRNAFEGVNIDFTGCFKIMGWEDNYITLEVRNESWLSQCVTDLKKELSNEGVYYQKQEFIPHLSIGRCKRNILFKDKVIIKPISAKINGINLYESISSSKKVSL